MKKLLTFGQMLDVHARLQPARIGARDLERSLSFEAWNGRAKRLANGLLGLGLAKGDRVAILAYNCLEWAEIYAAVAKAGIIAVPINFRLTAAEAAFIVRDAGARAVIAQAALVGTIEEVRGGLDIPAGNYIRFGPDPCPPGWTAYEALITGARDTPPDVDVHSSEPWALMYTSGTTGAPKGVIHSHHGIALLGLVTEIELAVHRVDEALLVMPMCHANSLFFFTSFFYCGGATTIYSRASFDPEEALGVMSDCGATFTSLVPTHYIMMLAVAERERGRFELGRMRKMMISSAPARADTKRAVMEMFPNSGLFELYGSSEAGWVTMLHPDEQFSHLGTVGRECVGSAPVRLLDAQGQEVPDGEPGELFSCTPYAFDGYWNRPELTAQAFRGDYCTVGDMALRDRDGFLKLVDRKKNMIISGGENIYPSEVEAVLGACPLVKDVAVIGLPDDKWGERVHGVVVLHDGATADAAALIEWCRPRLAGYKRPRSVTFLGEDEMPRTATGKVLHRVLRARLAESTRDGS